jgi:hypothetical protein
MHETKFEVGELIFYPSWDDNNMTTVHTGVVIESFLNENDLEERLSHGHSTMYRIMGEHVEGDGWYHSWELMKLDPQVTPE